MDRRRFVFSLALVPLIPLLPPKTHLRVILPKDCQMQELLEHLKQISDADHFIQDSLEFRLADGRCLALDTAFKRRRVVEYDFRESNVKPVFYNETSFLPSSVTPDAYYLFLCACVYAQRPLWGRIEESKTVGQFVNQLPKGQSNLFSLWRHEAVKSLGNRVREG